MHEKIKKTKTEAKATAKQERSVGDELIGTTAGVTATYVEDCFTCGLNALVHYRKAFNTLKLINEDSDIHLYDILYGYSSTCLSNIIKNLLEFFDNQRPESQAAIRRDMLNTLNELKARITKQSERPYA